MQASRKICGDSVEMREMAARICRDYLNGAWKNVTADNIGFKHISGGLSNWLYHVWLPSSSAKAVKHPRDVLIRVYGQMHGERALEALITESVIFTLLSERGLGPRLHGVFPGGRLEQYIAARPLRTNELCKLDVSKEIARREISQDSFRLIWFSWSRDFNDNFAIIWDNTAGGQPSSGGLSNWLYHVWLPSSSAKAVKHPRDVLIRVYGQMHGERALEALITESVIFTLLSERGLGPRLHGVFPGGRLEQYIAARPLRTNELCKLDVSKEIARREISQDSFRLIWFSWSRDFNDNFAIIWDNTAGGQPSSGGLSNWLYHVWLPSSSAKAVKHPRDVLIRVYGQMHGERALEALITESVIFTLLSERGLGPRLHGVFPGGRLEQYIAARPLRTNELCKLDVSKEIARREISQDSFRLIWFSWSRDFNDNFAIIWDNTAGGQPSSGGLSNWLYHVWLPSSSAKAVKHPRDVLIRVYGQMHGERALEALITESVVFTLLSERGLGPRLHGVFPGGRLEQYIAARPLRTNELCKLDVSKEIARREISQDSFRLIWFSWSRGFNDNFAIIWDNTAGGQPSSGGLSNWLYHVWLPSSSAKAVKHPRDVLIRVYGQMHGERALEALITESVIFTLLSERGLGPRLHGVFPGGRLEQYIAARPLRTNELCKLDVSKEIARREISQDSFRLIWFSWSRGFNDNFAIIWDNTAGGQPSSGGLSNWLYHVWLPSSSAKAVKHPRDVLIRVYGQMHGERALEALITESVIFTLLSERGLGPRLHGVFPGGRLEQYIAARPLRTNELCKLDVSKEIARKLALVHTMEVPLSKEPRWLWDTLSRWQKICQPKLQDKSVPKSAEFLQQLDLKAEINYLKKIISLQPSPVVFCHNDFQEGNILLQEDDKAVNNNAKDHPKLVLIDFEYCSYNYRGFDIANHFLEWTYDYSVTSPPNYAEIVENYPTREQQLHFIQNYLSETGSKEKPESLLPEIKTYSLASHLFWGLWAVVNAGSSQITFGYWEYAASRLGAYLRLKQQLPLVEKTQKRKIEDTL